MPRRTEPESAESRAVREVYEEDERALAVLASQASAPPDSERLSEADEDEAWGLSDPSVDPEGLAQQLTTTGLGPDAQRLLIVRLRPDWAQLFSQPTPDPERARMLAQLARYPYRLSLLEASSDPDEQVSKAERLDRRFQQRMRAPRVRTHSTRATPFAQGRLYPALPARVSGDRWQDVGVAEIPAAERSGDEPLSPITHHPSPGVAPPPDPELGG